jgi:hypothetical protein
VSGIEHGTKPASCFEKKLLDGKRVLFRISFQAPPSDTPFPNKKGGGGRLRHPNLVANSTIKRKNFYKGRENRVLMTSYTKVIF